MKLLTFLILSSLATISTMNAAQLDLKCHEREIGAALSALTDYGMLKPRARYHILRDMVNHGLNNAIPIIASIDIIDRYDIHGRTALHDAVTHGAIETASLLISFGAHPYFEPPVTNNVFKSPALWAEYLYADSPHDSPDARERKHKILSQLRPLFQSSVIQQPLASSSRLILRHASADE